MIRRWGHGHSIAVGGGGMLLLASHTWLLVLAAFAAGVAVTVSAQFLRRSAGKAGNVVDAQAALAWERVKEVRARRRAQVDKRRATRSELDAAFKRGYIEGRLEG